MLRKSVGYQLARTRTNEDTLRIPGPLAFSSNQSRSIIFTNCTMPEYFQCRLNSIPRSASRLLDSVRGDANVGIPLPPSLVQGITVLVCSASFRSFARSLADSTSCYVRTRTFASPVINGADIDHKTDRGREREQWRRRSVRVRPRPRRPGITRMATQGRTNRRMWRVGGK